ncbi:MAG TPA: SHOCT domain-containing protein [Acidimicrobiales bacterium]
MLVATTWGTGQVLLDIVWFFLIFIEIWLMISIFIDIFRRQDMRGWLKALWVVVVIVAPILGIVLYLIIYGNDMRVHDQQAADQQERVFRTYVRDAAGTPSPSEELAQLADLRDRGIIDDKEFCRLKERVVSGSAN